MYSERIKCSFFGKENPKSICSTLSEWNARARWGRVLRVEFTNTFRGGCRSRFRRQHQRRVVGDDRTAFQVPFVRVHVIGAPLEPAAGESAQISGQTPFSRHEIQPHFEFLLEFFLQTNRRTGGGAVEGVKEQTLSDDVTSNVSDPGV